MMSGSFLTKVGRRGLLTGALIAGASLATGSGPAAAQDDRAARGRMIVPRLTRRPSDEDEIPQVLAATGAAASAPDFPIGYAGLTWSGASTGGRVRFRTAAGWGAWQPVRPGDACGEDRQAALIPAGGAVEIDLEPPPEAGDVQLLAINTTDGPASGVPTAAPSRRYGCRYRSRAGWGADESWRLDPDGRQLWPAEYHAAQALTVHHTVTANNDPDPVATVRAIYYFQAVTRGWGDIGYHLLIDRAGVVYEGRYSRRDGVPVFRRGTRRVVIAGHVLGFNPGNIGVALLGDLTGRQPTAAARRALVRVLAHLARTTRLNPRGRTTYRNPVNRDTRTVDIISGHRDWRATQCPGNTFYPTLPRLRRDVAALRDRDLRTR
jgi:hypothetical protein